MKVAGVLFFVLLTSFQSGKFVSQKGVDPKTLTFDQIETYVQNVNLQKSKKKLTKYEHQELTVWGGLTGYWGKSDLLMAESVFNAEAGFVKTTVYFNEGEICRLVVEKHMANWAEYERDHGHEEYDASKITYTDVFYDYTIGKETVCRVLKDNKMVPKEVDNDLLEEDLASAKDMRKFLEEIDF